MDKTSDEQIGYIIANLMVYYKGALTYDRLMTMPIPLLLDYLKYAGKIEKEKETVLNNKMKGVK